VAPSVLTAQAVADLVGGRLLGDGTFPVTRVGPLDRADGNTLSFLVSTRYLAYFRASRAGVVLLTPEFEKEPKGPETRIVVQDPYRAILSVLPRFLVPTSAEVGVHPSAVIGNDVKLGPEVAVGPHVAIGPGASVGARTHLAAGVVIERSVVIGEDCVLGANVVCHEGTRLGNRVVLKAGAVIGGQGFGYLPTTEGHQKIPHSGACILEDDVEVGSNSTVDRGSLDDTVIGRGTKIDNLVHVAHNIRIGERCLLMATTGLAGSVRIGNQVIVAGGVGIADHVRVGDGATISARSTVISDIPPKSVYGGYPARPHREFLRAQAALYRMTPLARDLETLVTERKQSAQTND
jgi:UDP-3-O-[3-hydroxymyristoyl] glucosamine N-acyltransferase